MFKITHLGYWKSYLTIIGPNSNEKLTKYKNRSSYYLLQFGFIYPYLAIIGSHVIQYNLVLLNNIDYSMISHIRRPINSVSVINYHNDILQTGIHAKVKTNIQLNARCTYEVYIGQHCWVQQNSRHIFTFLAPLCHLAAELFKCRFVRRRRRQL